MYLYIHIYIYICNYVYIYIYVYIYMCIVLQYHSQQSSIISMVNHRDFSEFAIDFPLVVKSLHGSKPIISTIFYLG